MRRFRFHIGSLLILIVLLGVGFAALREANDLWDSIVLSVAILVMAVSVLLAIHRKAEKRAFWVAFALFGWGYLGLTALPSIESRLMTTKALSYLDSQVPGRSVVITGGTTGVGTIDPIALTVRSIAFSPDGNILAASNNAGTVRAWNASAGRLVLAGGTTENFVWIGHSLFALILAWLGGRLSRHLHISSRDSNPASESVEATGAE